MSDGHELNDKLEQLSTHIDKSFNELKQDVFRFLNTSALRVFENQVPYLSSPLPYQSLVQVSSAKNIIHTSLYNTQDRIEARTQDDEKVMMHPMVSGAILPCQLKPDTNSSDQKTIALSLMNDTGFFYLDMDYIDLWSFHSNQAVSTLLYEQLVTCQFALSFYMKDGSEIHPKVSVDPIHFAHFHPNELCRIMLREPRYFQSLRLSFNNDFRHSQVSEIKLTISSERVLEEQLKTSLLINQIPLVLSDSIRAMPIQLDGTQDYYPLVIEEEDMSFSKVQSVEVFKHSGESYPVYPRTLADADELSYEIVRPNGLNTLNHTHIALSNLTFNEDRTLIVKGLWFKSKSHTGQLKDFSFIALPVEKLKVRSQCFTEALKDCSCDFNIIQQIENIAHTNELSSNQFLVLCDLLLKDPLIKKICQPIYTYIEHKKISGHKLNTFLDIVEDTAVNTYLNSVVNIILKFHQSLLSN